MIETSKYLTNAKIIEKLQQINHDNVDEVEEEQKQVRDGLLQFLGSITNKDFDEYNARPYTRYSLNAILNLHDFANDQALRTASQIVLDLSGAKFAAASNRGRRIVPYRRLAKHDERPLYEMVEGSDHEVARAVVLAGQTQLLGDGIDGGGLPSVNGDGFSSMIYPAVSPYRWPRPVLEVAIERKGTFAQDIRHAGIEGYFSLPSFTMSLGGTRRPAALSVLGLENSDDRGVAMPTVIIPTTAGHIMTDLFAMNGNGTQDKRTDNTCGWRGFICGIQPTLSMAYASCRAGELSGAGTGPDFFYVNSAACPAPAGSLHFYLALKSAPCDDTFCQRGRGMDSWRSWMLPGRSPVWPTQSFAISGSIGVRRWKPRCPMCAVLVFM
jgi:hypothetical protein